MEYKEYGYFSDDGREFVITERKTPRHFYNYFFNDEFNSFSSQVGFGEGIAQDDMGHRVPLITDRTVYIVDRQSGSFHLATGLPMTESFDFFECHHGRGYSTIICEKNSVRSEYTIFVPASGMRERWIVKLENLRKDTASLGVIGYAATDSDHIYTPQGYNKSTSRYYSESGAVAIKNECKMLAPKSGFAYDYMLSDGTPSAFDTRRTAFIGTYGSKEYPEALTFGTGCKNTDTVTEKSCFALERDISLASGESIVLVFEVGHTDSPESLVEIKRNLTLDSTYSMLEEVKAQREREISGVKITTPDEKLNRAFPFYQYANNMGSRWARVRHNGYRDIVQDTCSLSSVAPKLAWERFKRILRYQRPTGYCPRTFINGKIQDNNFSDNGVYVAGTAYDIVCELGDSSLLLEEVEFSDGTRASVFEHLRRSYDFLYNFQGLHGLIRIWGGDWHDGMNLAGLEGRGVSVMLSMAFVRYNDIFIKLANMLGENELVKKHSEMSADMRCKIKNVAFSDGYYCTAINDEGRRIGAPESEGAKIFINPQTWAVMAGLGDREEQLSLMRVLDEKLETPLGTKFNYPVYTEYDSKVGTLTSQAPGTLINGAVYLQPQVWRLIADCILGRAPEVQRSIEKILPWNHKYAVTYGEPYILYNFYHEAEAGYRYGTAGQSWRTATHSIFVEAMVRYVFGLRPTLEGLVLSPCLPPDWKECSIEKNFRGTKYKINYHQGTDGRGIFVDGKRILGNLLPLYEKSVTVDCYI